MSHTKEPWRTTEMDRVISDTMEKLNDDYFIADCFGPDAKENARRIVACVNACRDFETEELEEYYDGKSMDLKFVIDNQAYAIGETENEKEDLKSQRDELLSALKDVEYHIEFYSLQDIKKYLKAKIAKCEAQFVSVNKLPRITEGDARDIVTAWIKHLDDHDETVAIPDFEWNHQEWKRILHALLAKLNKVKP